MKRGDVSRQYYPPLHQSIFGALNPPNGQFLSHVGYNPSNNKSANHESNVAIYPSLFYNFRLLKEVSMPINFIAARDNYIQNIPTEVPMKAAQGFIATAAISLLS